MENIMHSGDSEVDLYLEVASTDEAYNLSGGSDYNGDGYNENMTTHTDFISHLGVQIMFITIYTTIFILGIFGNTLVCIVVGRNKAMQTVTNFFIKTTTARFLSLYVYFAIFCTNLALADILLNSLAVPFTPLYTFLQEWIFGRVLCHLVAYAQGTSVYISTFTLTSIAIDRFLVILYPFRPRMKLTTCIGIITIIWLFSLLATLPYVFFLQYGKENGIYVCIEVWPSERIRKLFSVTTAILQFVLPFIIITLCYIRVSLKLTDRARARPGKKNSRKEALERERKRRTNRMLIAMVTIFGASWLPLNLVNLISDVYMSAADWEYYNLCFFLSHAIAMSSTIYNPLLYAWLNENFRKEFKQVLPCFRSTPIVATTSQRCLSERTCNGNETVQESYQPTCSQANATGSTGFRVGTLETIEEQTSNSQSAGISINIKESVVKYSCSATNEVQVHNSDSPTKSERRNSETGSTMDLNDVSKPTSTMSVSFATI